MMRPKGQLCERARQWSSLRLDGELSELEGALLDSHLARCADCRAFAADTAWIVDALRAAPVERVDARVTVVAPRSTRRIHIAAVAATCVLVLLAAAAGSLLGVADQNGSTRTAQSPKRTAMIASADSVDQLRKLRRPTLVGSRRGIPRRLTFVGEIG
jgi:predicted anti-sigma-YlaC factor YlaD